MAKSTWKGDISFGLVSIPVSLVPIEADKDIHFHLLDSKTQARVRYQRVSEETGKEVLWKDIVKGYEYEKDRYIMVNDAAFEKASPSLFKTIEIEEFVDLNEVDTLYFTKPYYLIPQSKNKKAYVLLREALKETNKAGLAKIIIRTKESLCLIIPHDYALLLYLIHFKEELLEEDEINLPKDAVSSYKITEKEIKMAVSLIKEMSTKWNPDHYHNEYRETLQKWLDQQIAKQSKSTSGRSRNKGQNAGDIVDFISLLKKSMKNKNLKKKS